MKFAEFIDCQKALAFRLLRPATNPPPGLENPTVEEFHKLYYNDSLVGGTWTDTRWMGHRTWKCPLDLWIYQELIHSIQPDLIIETGTAEGGGALFLATICDIVGHGHVVSIDIKPKAQPPHRRITYIVGSSLDGDVIERIRNRRREKTLVILDSDHSQEHVMSELNAYGRLVTVGSYMIVEDTNLHGHPICPEHVPGPYEAVEAWLPSHPEFERDRRCEKFMLTFNPGGYLKRMN